MLRVDWLPRSEPRSMLQKYGQYANILYRADDMTIRQNILRKFAGQNKPDAKDEL